MIKSRHIHPPVSGNSGATRLFIHYVSGDVEGHVKKKHGDSGLADDMPSAPASCEYLDNGCLADTLAGIKPGPLTPISCHMHASL